ncbi:somatostatin receptor type 5-like [Branchiostoma floridae x Branchiostoma japonicum]
MSGRGFVVLATLLVWRGTALEQLQFATTDRNSTRPGLSCLQACTACLNHVSAASRLNGNCVITQRCLKTFEQILGKAALLLGSSCINNNNSNAVYQDKFSAMSFANYTSLWHETLRNCGKNCSDPEMQWRPNRDLDIFLTTHATSLNISLESPDITFIPSELAITVISAVVIVGLLGNALVFYTLCGRARTSAVISSYILNLSAADSICVLTSPLMLSQDAFDALLSLGNVVCVCGQTVYMVTLAASMLTLATMCVERYLAVAHPLQSLRWRSAGKARAACVLTWVFAVLLSLPMFIFWKLRPQNGADDINQCDWHADQLWLSVYYSVYGVMMGSLGLLIFVLYCCMLSRHSARRDDQQPDSCHESRRIRAVQRKVVRMVLVLLMVLSFSYLPYYTWWLVRVTHSFSTMGLASQTFERLEFGLFTLTYLNNCLNPFMYTLLSENYRETFRAACQCVNTCCCCNSHRTLSSPAATNSGL